MHVHDFIRVTGARDNNLRGVSVDIPKRQLTVFTGVSGSGKSSLVFDTIAAESQRLVNETYPGFVQGFMQSLPRPDVDRLEGLTAAVIVGQEPMAANARSTFGTATDITPALRVLFSRAAEPRAGGPGAYSFNVPSVSAQGGMSVNGKKKKELTRFERTGGMCPTCEGRGTVSDIDLSAVVDESLSLDDGAILLPGLKVGSWTWKAYTQSGLYPTDVPVREFTEEQRHALLELDGIKTKLNGINVSYQGLLPRMRGSMLAKDPASLQKHVREFVERAVQFVTCPACEGTRLAQHARHSQLAGKSIADVCALELSDALAWLDALSLPQVAPLVDSIAQSLRNAIELGLGYLTLDRPAGTLSGGEAQRTRMVRHLSSALTDATYVFDEPTVGLHPHDIARLGRLLLALRDKGNTVLVVEHKPEIIELVDYVVDLGPGAGSEGGEIMFAGTVAELRAVAAAGASAESATSRHLADRAHFKDTVREPTGAIEVRGASKNNLRDVDVDIPRGVFTCITGIAGSGKSSLMDCLPGSFLLVDQKPIKGSRRSNPATYTGALDSIRSAFAKANGVKPALFSANSEGACPNCNGAGTVFVELGFMSGVDVPCEVCEGRRFADAVLDFRLTAGEESLTIADVLELPAARAAEFLRAAKVTAAARICDDLVAVGLSYLTLGQSLTTLSGGERQRLKLAVHLGELATARRAKKAPADPVDVIVLDEPTTGLHLADIDTLVRLIDRFVDEGMTVIAVEHHLAVVARADHVIDLGPGAGSAGGRVIAQASPRALAADPGDSLTGKYLATYVEGASAS
ncbi:excinuclease ABC subunit UvrA [Corynebacterium sp. CMW7794]|uniref:excinuclease ABC subunit UvrA n=1 Tax=Corynebacterium sp. CMW7794 TaxID=1603887 RepID=UPI0008377806